MPWLFLQENLSLWAGRVPQEPQHFSGLTTGWAGLQDAPWIALSCSTDIPQTAERKRTLQTVSCLILGLVSEMRGINCPLQVSLSLCWQYPLEQALNFQAAEIRQGETHPNWLTVFFQWPTESIKETSVKYVTLLRFCHWFLLPAACPWGSWSLMLGSCSEKWIV